MLRCKTIIKAKLAHFYPEKAELKKQEQENKSLFVTRSLKYADSDYP